MAPMGMPEEVTTVECLVPCFSRSTGLCRPVHAAGGFGDAAIDDNIGQLQADEPVVGFKHYLL